MRAEAVVTNNCPDEDLLGSQSVGLATRGATLNRCPGGSQAAIAVKKGLIDSPGSRRARAVKRLTIPESQLIKALVEMVGASKLRTKTEESTRTLDAKSLAS